MPIIRSSRQYLCYYRIWCVMSWLLVVGGQVQGSRLCVLVEGNCSTHPGSIACCPAPDHRPPATKALHTIYGNNTSIVSISWWWAYKCLKHVEQIISAIRHSVASSWFSSLRLYNDACTNIQQISVCSCRDASCCRLIISTLFLFVKFQFIFLRGQTMRPLR